MAGQLNYKSLIILALLFSSLGVAACGTGEASVSSAEETVPLPVIIAHPERAEIAAIHTATASIESDRDAPVLARVPGEIVELLVEEGERVAAGQLLARLDGERLRLEMLSARANLDRARGEYERYVDLNRRGLVSEAMFDGLRYELEAIEASYELAALNLEYAGIRATIPGIVSERSVKLGQNVAVGQPLFRITDTRELIAHLKIPQTEIAKFAPGHAATVAVDSMPDRTFVAAIVRVSPTIDVVNGTFRATAAIDNREGMLAPGMFGRFGIAYERHADALTIPASALLEEDDETSVYVVVDGKVARRSIVVGIATPDRIEVESGLSEQDRVVVVGHGALRDGSKVIASAAATAAG